MESPHPAPPSEPPPAMATVTDRRVPPKGVIPRGIQTWLLAGLALFMLAIMLIVGRPEPQTPKSGRRGADSTTPVQSADRVREYQERLRFAEARALAQTQAPAEPTVSRTPTDAFAERRSRPPEDPIAAERSAGSTRVFSRPTW